MSEWNSRPFKVDSPRDEEGSRKERRSEGAGKRIEQEKLRLTVTLTLLTDGVRTDTDARADARVSGSCGLRIYNLLLRIDRSEITSLRMI